MTQQKIMRIAVLVSATIHSVTNAFVPIKTHSNMAQITSVHQGRSLLSQRGYSINNIEDRSKEDSFDASESTDPVNIEFLFNNESGSLADTPPPTNGFDSELLQASDVSDSDAHAI